jgi:alkylated DNA repair dioxygenase AlkB
MCYCILYVGDITCITTVSGEAVFEIRQESTPSQASQNTSPIYSIPLTAGSFVLLSGESRWKWEHRVLPKSISEVSEVVVNVSNDVGRISLVLGCK